MSGSTARSLRSRSDYTLVAKGQRRTFHRLHNEPLDVLDGRFRLPVGRYRGESRGLAPKIPWFGPARSSIGRPTLTLSAVRFGPRPRRYELTRSRAESSDSPPTSASFPGPSPLPPKADRV